MDEMLYGSSIHTTRKTLQDYSQFYNKYTQKKPAYSTGLILLTRFILSFQLFVITTAMIQKYSLVFMISVSAQ
jgi:hypothetical protein